MMPRRTKAATLLSIGLLAIGFGFATGVFWTTPYIMTLIALPFPFLLSLLYTDKKRAWRLALVGMILGPLVEIACVFGGLWTYPITGGLPGVPLWLLPGWACFPLALVAIAETLTGRPFRTPTGVLAPYLLASAILMQTALFVSLGHETLSGFMVAAWLTVGVVLFLRSAETAVLFVAGGVIGPLVESWPITQGTWSYHHADLLGMPGYMPWAYGLFAIFVVTFAVCVADAPPPIVPGEETNR